MQATNIQESYCSVLLLLERRLQYIFATSDRPTISECESCSTTAAATFNAVPVDDPNCWLTPAHAAGGDIAT